MKVLLRRDQKQSGMIGVKITFTLAVRAELSQEEKDNIRKYKLGDTVLYEKKNISDAGGLLRHLAAKMLNLTISVNDLVNGKTVEVESIVEMIAAEIQIREACQTFKDALTAAAQFGGEEIITI